MRRHARILAASIFGTAVEYYDFYLYGYAAALVFGPLFFPAKSEAAQTLLSFMSFGIAFLARPVGAVAFGHFGDRIGRKATLVASLMTMGFCTLAIAFLPTYQTAGWIAPAMLCLLRFGQGFGLGGEWAGAALITVENAPRGWQCRFGMMPALGAALGNIFATGVFLLMGMIVSEQQFVAWGWRIPFLASGILIAIGLWVRAKIEETPEFHEAKSKKSPPRVPIVKLFAKNSPSVLAGAAGIICGFSLVYMAGPFALAQGTGTAGVHRDTFLLVQLVALVCALPLVVLFAMRADRATPTKYVAASALAAVPVGFAFGPSLASGSLWLSGLCLFALNACWAVNNAGVNTWLCRLYPVRVRYSGFAFAFNTGGLIGGAVIPIVAQLISAGGGLRYVGLLVSAAGLVTYSATVLSRSLERRRVRKQAQPATA